MVFGLGFGAGLKALTAARLGIQTAGHNVSNANTVGYSRQRVLQSASLPFAVSGGYQIGTGVLINDITRITDNGLERRLRLQIGLSAEAEVKFNRWKEIEGAFDEPNGGLSKGLGELFSRIGKLQTEPADRALRGGVVQGGQQIAEGFNLLSRRFADLKESTFDEARGLVREVNQLAAQIAELNREIVSAESNGISANDLRDTREQHIKQIAEFVDTQALDRNNGSLDLMVGGYLLVSGDRTTPLTVTRNSANLTEVRIGSTTQALSISGGKLAALIEQESSEQPAMIGRLDRLARNLALEFNRIHTTGVPRSGPFTDLVSFYGSVDNDSDGGRGDELLNEASLPFDVQAGELHIAVTQLSNGDIERTRIAIDPQSMSLQDVAAAIDDIENLSATVDPAGRLRITSQSGYGFDFAPRLDASPNTFGGFGGASPSVATTTNGPFNITVPSDFIVNIDGTNRTVTLTGADFDNPATATVDELVDAINADIGSYATARNIGGRLSIRSDSSGSTATMSLTDGTNGPLAALGLSGLTGTNFSGQDAGVEVSVSGKYTGTDNGQLLFVPESDGTIGATANLTIGVFDTNGVKVATLNVGAGDYSPGDVIEVTDGVKVSFGPGTVSATTNDVFALDTLADSDTSDLLAAIGMNSFFHGSSAEDLAVNAELERNPDLLAAALTDASGDAENLRRLLDLRESGLEDLDGSSFEDFYGDVVGDLGFEVSIAESTLLAQGQLLAGLEQQRERISGVNLDEEMVDLTRYQQAFEAASRFINTVSELSETLINLGR